MRQGMLQSMKACVTGGPPQILAGAVGLLVGLGLGLAAPSLGAVLGAGPILMAAVCLLPCLAPLLLLRRNQDRPVTPRDPGPGAEAGGRARPAP